METAGSPSLSAIETAASTILFGILLVNIGLFASVYTFFGAENPAFNSGIDHAVHWVQALFIDTKFYLLLFSFLFGYSFTLQKKGFLINSETDMA
jgi:uncharacterized protein